MLTLGTDTSGDPPDGRVIEQQRLDDGLQEVDDVVVTPDMCQLVRDERFDLRRRQAGERGGRQQDNRLHPADHHRNGDRGRFEDAHHAIERHPSGDAPDQRMDFGRHRAHRTRDQSARDDPAAQQPK